METTDREPILRLAFAASTEESESTSEISESLASMWRSLLRTHEEGHTGLLGPGQDYGDRPTQSWLRKEFAPTRSPGFSGHEDWNSVMTIDARIIEVMPDRVKLDCLISRSSEFFETRIFKRSLLEGAVSCEPGKYVVIRIFERPGKIAYTFSNGDRIVRKELFEDTSRFDDLDNLGLDEPLQ